MRAEETSPSCSTVAHIYISLTESEKDRARYKFMTFTLSNPRHQHTLMFDDFVRKSDVSES